jgi:hypothetical protein
LHDPMMITPSITTPLSIGVGMICTLEGGGSFNLILNSCAHLSISINRWQTLNVKTQSCILGNGFYLNCTMSVVS